MKRSIIAGSVLLTMAVIFAACSKRDYTCVCTYVDKYQTYPTTQETIVKGKNINEARNACYAHGTYLMRYANTDVPCYVR